MDSVDSAAVDLAAAAALAAATAVEDAKPIAAR